MSNLLNTRILSLDLKRNSRSCHISICNDSDFDLELFSLELEKTLDWLTNKVEIYSVIFNFKYSKLNLSDYLNLENDEKKVLEIIKRIQRLSWCQLMLPQTIIWQLCDEMDYLAYEMTVGGDIRTAGLDMTISFSALNKGMTPGCGGSHLLSQILDTNKVKYLFMTSALLNSKDALDMGLLNSISAEYEVNQMVLNIYKQSPTARIQFKRSINNSIIESFDDAMSKELSFSKATLAIGDWLRSNKSEDFLNPREVTKILQRTPTKNTQSETTH